MAFRIVAIKTVKDSTLLYVEVDFLNARGFVVHRNDFVMQISPTVRRYIGPPLEEDQLPDPADYIIEDNDNVRDEILANIDRYRARIAVRTPQTDSRDAQLRADAEDTDPLGLRSKPGVSELIGVVQERG